MSTRVNCNFCKKTFANDRTLDTHQRKFHTVEFTRNGINFSLNNQTINSSFLADYNTSICEKSINRADFLETSEIDSSIENGNFQADIKYYLKNYHSNLSISSLNINSLSDKFSNISFMLEQQLVDVLILNETKLNSNHDNHYFENAHYDFFRRDRQSGGGGGIIVYVKKTLKVFNVSIDDKIEMISLIISPRSNINIGLIACYRPPHPDNIPQFFSSLESKIIELEESTSETFIAGDLNFNMLSNEGNQLTEFNDIHGFKNTIFKGTRLNPSTLEKTLLDVILCYNRQNLLSSEVFFTFGENGKAFSDHALIVSIFNFGKFIRKQEPIQTRCLSKDNLMRISLSLLSIFSTFIFESQNANTQWSILKDIIMSCIDKHAPLKVIPVKKTNAYPWVDSDYLKRCKKRDKIYTKIIGNLVDCYNPLWETYKRIRNDCKKMFHQKKSSYFSEFIMSESTSSKKLWKKLAPNLKPNSKPALNSTLILKELRINPDLDLANLFCNYFSSITSSFKFEPLSLCLEYSTKLFNLISKVSISNNSLFQLNEFSTDEVITALKSLKPNSGAGEVGIESSVFIESADALGNSIKNLFNLIIKTGMFPDEWKVAHVTPIYKGKGSKSTLENYRPISILPPIAKLFESLITKKLYDHLESEGLLHDTQYGFRKSRSCELALNSMIQSWRESLGSEKEVFSLFLDFSKAFDTVDHTLLIQKLNHYHLHADVIRLLENYLSKRSIRVRVNKELSKRNPLGNVSVPQGSCLGPLLFIIYINDLSHLRTNSKKWLFADDTTLVIDGKDINEMKENLQHDLSKITEWLKYNRLIINLSKTHIMHTTSHPHKYKSISNETIEFNGEPIKFVSSTRLLGVMIDNKLKFDDHIKKICNKVNSTTTLLAKSSHLFPKKFKTTLFKLFIIPNFDYCRTLFMKLPSKTGTEKLDKNYKKSIRRILKINLFNKTLLEQYNILSKYNILPFLYRSFYHFCTFLFSFKSNNNIEFSKKLILNNRTSISSFYKETGSKSNFNKFSFILIGTKLLNHFYQQDLKKDKENKFFFNTNCKFKNFLKNNIIELYQNTLQITHSGKNVN